MFPWTNAFDTFAGDSSIGNYNSYRKISGSSIISPFEYSLSINDTYLLLLSYRLNQREYFEEKFTFDYSSQNLEFDFMPYNIDTYLEVFEADSELALNVYYYDGFGKMRFLDDSHYTYDLVEHTLTLEDDENVIVRPNGIDDFYVSFSPILNDKQFKAYQYSYSPIGTLEDSLSVDYWEVINGERLDVVPNLDAYRFMDEFESNFTNYICRATQISAFLEDGQALSFDIGGELGWFDQELVTSIRNGDYIDLYIRILLIRWSSREWNQYNDKENEIIYDKGGNRRHPSSYSAEEKAELLRIRKKMTENFEMVDNSICKCFRCVATDKNMTYNPVEKAWFCFQCYEEMKRWTMKKKTGISVRFP